MFPYPRQVRAHLAVMPDRWRTCDRQRWHECAIQFVTWGDGEPAAASSIEVWELADALSLTVLGDLGDGSRRE